METFNRYIDGGSKRDQMSDLHRIENPNAKYGLVARTRGISACVRLGRDKTAWLG